MTNDDARLRETAPLSGNKCNGFLVAQAEIVFELFQDLGDIQGFTGVGEHMIILVFLGAEKIWMPGALGKFQPTITFVACPPISRAARFTPGEKAMTSQTSMKNFDISSFTIAGWVSIDWPKADIALQA